MPDDDADLLVIGGGSGGIRAARAAASHGARVIVAEEDRVGGTCVIRGCVPKKLMVYAAQAAQDIADAAGLGWTLPGARFDWATLAANRDREVARLEAAYHDGLRKASVRLVKARASLLDPSRVRLSTGETLRARHILIATGGRPVVSPVPGGELAIVSDDVFDLPALPERVVIQGSGYIGVEFACILAGLGSKVTLVCRSDTLLRGFDADVRAHLRAELQRTGIAFETGCAIAGIARAGSGLGVDLSTGRRLEADQVLVALGRRPNVAGLGLERAGVALDRGAIRVDTFSRTSVEGVFAVGDVTDRVALTPAAIREGQAFADTVFGGRPTPVEHGDIPTAVFSLPEVGTVGLTEAEALSRFPALDVFMATFRPMKATVTGRETRMLIKLLVDRATDRVVGCHIVGAAAAEIIQIAGVALRMRATKADFDTTLAVHPTAAEELVTMRSPTRRHGLAR